MMDMCTSLLPQNTSNAVLGYTCEKVVANCVAHDGKGLDGRNIA
jgi:hypothetical protein